MQEVLFWLYIINSLFLINHEIDSAYWHEWNLFKIKGGITTFLILHFPILFFILYGLIEVYNQTYTGLIFSLILSAIGIFAFTIHIIFIKKGQKEFKTPISIFILCGILVISLIQIIITIILLNN
jgi:ABC-type Fe3+-siderophore transport system permease subunit